MPRPAGHFFLLASVLATAPLASAAEQPASTARVAYTIQLGFEKGQLIKAKALEHIELQMNLDIKMDVEGQAQKQSQEILQETTTSQVFEEEVLTVIDGQPSKIRREYETYSTKMKTDPPMPEPEDETTLEGASVIFSRTGEETSARLEGKAQPKLQPLLEQLESLNQEYAPFLPAQPVRLNDKWTVDQKYFQDKLKKLLPRTGREGLSMKITNSSGSMECRLKDVREESSGLIGVIEVNSDLEAEFNTKAKLEQESGEEDQAVQVKAVSDTTLSIKAKTTLEINLTKRQLMSDATTGTMRLHTTADIEEPAPMTMTIKAKGPIENTTIFTYLKK